MYLMFFLKKSNKTKKFQINKTKLKNQIFIVNLEIIILNIIHLYGMCAKEEKVKTDLRWDWMRDEVDHMYHQCLPKTLYTIIKIQSSRH